MFPTLKRKVALAGAGLALSVGGVALITPAALAQPISPPPLHHVSVSGTALCGTRYLPSGVTRTEVGYQPAGMKPKERLFPGWLTSNTATALLSALATNKSSSSGERARLFGVEPGGAWGKSADHKVSRGFPARVSNTVTVFRLAFAANRYRPERLRAISHGWSSAGQRAMTCSVRKSTTAILACALVPGGA